MKKYIKSLLLVFVLLFSFSFVYALEEKEVSSNETAYNDGSSRLELDNYGVNKKWNINEKNKSNVLRTPKVDASLKVYDYANILSESDEKEIKSLIDNYIELTNMDMVFVTIDMPYVSDSKNEEYAADFYDYNDFGLDFDKYSGVLLLRNNYSEDRFFNVYTFGEAQLYYSFDRCEFMLDDIYPNFKNDEYLAGFKVFVSDFTRFYNSGKDLDDYSVDDMGFIHKEKGKFKAPIGTCVMLGVIVSTIVLIIMVKKNKMVKKSTQANDYIDKSTMNYKKKTDQFLTTYTSRHRISSDSYHSGGGGGGFSSSIGSSGGGHGGGGGRHG